MGEGAGLPANPETLTPAERQWLHDKYQRLDQGEAELMSYRASYFVAVTTALIAALVYAIVNLLTHGPLLFALTSSLLGGFGLVIAVLWAVVVRRTTEAQFLWREAARQLEIVAPPIDRSSKVSIDVRGRGPLTVDLTRPYLMHELRFSVKQDAPWLDRTEPATLTTRLPLVVLGLWMVVLVGAWIWFAASH
jgi:hypothetical protein